MKDTKKFIEEAKQVHGNKYDYSKVEYKNAFTKVCIICPEHGEFWQRPSSHLTGRGCEKCSYEYRSLKKIEKAKRNFIEKAIQKHGNKYDYSKVNYITAKTKVCIICPDHGEFWQTPTGHLSGKGCAKCNGGVKLNTEIFIEKAKEIHGDKYNYSKVHYGKNNMEKVCIICPDHGEFWQAPSKHLTGHQCPKCKESHLEREIRVMLEENNIEYIYQANKKDCPWLKKQTYDFYIPNKKIAIECQGEQHYSEISFGNWGKEERKKQFLKILRLDNRKKELSLLNDVTLIYYTHERLRKNEEITDLNKILEKIIE